MASSSRVQQNGGQHLKFPATTTLSQTLGLRNYRKSVSIIATLLLIARTVSPYNRTPQAERVSAAQRNRFTANACHHRRKHRGSYQASDRYVEGIHTQNKGRKGTRDRRGQQQRQQTENTQTHTPTHTKNPEQGKSAMEECENLSCSPHFLNANKQALKVVGQRISFAHACKRESPSANRPTRRRRRTCISRHPPLNRSPVCATQARRRSQSDRHNPSSSGRARSDLYMRRTHAQTPKAPEWWSIVIVSWPKHTLDQTDDIATIYKKQI